MFKLRTTFVGICLLLALIQGFETRSTMAIAHESVERCTVLTSGSDILGGLKIYVSGKSLKVLKLNGNAYLIASAPSWRVVLFNPNNNCGISMSSKEWMAHTPQFTYLAPLTEELPFVWRQTSPRSTKVLGRDCTKVRMHRHYKGTYDSNEHEYVFLSNPDFSEVACSILQKLLNVPSAKGIPISFRTLSTDPHKDGSQLFKTTRIEEGSEPEKFFSYPTDFKKARREVDVVSDSTRNRLIEDTFAY